MDQTLADGVIITLLGALLAVAGWALRRQVTSNQATRDAINRMAANFDVLNTGASAGARGLITDLRTELRTATGELARELGQLRREHDTLAERHNSAQITSATMAERINVNRETLLELRRELAAFARGLPPPTG